MIAPPPALRIEGTIARIPRYVPVRLMSITWRRSEAHDARVVDQHGDRAEGVLGGGHRRGPVPVARDVEAGEDRVIAELVGGRPPLLLEDVRDPDVRAPRGEAARVTGAPSPGPAPDQH